MTCQANQRHNSAPVEALSFLGTTWRHHATTITPPHPRPRRNPPIQTQIMASPLATKRLQRELKALHKTPLNNPKIVAAPNEANILEWHYVLEGPTDDPRSPYYGGIYHGKLIFPKEYPYKPPVSYRYVDACNMRRLYPSPRSINSRVSLCSRPTDASIPIDDCVFL